MTTLEAVDFYYASIIVLLVLCVLSLYWWWRDVQVTTMAMAISRKRLAELGIDLRLAPNELLRKLGEYSLVCYDDGSAEGDATAAHQLVLAGLWLLRFELSLNKSFFEAVVRTPGFEFGYRLLDMSVQCHNLRRFMLKSEGVRALVKSERKLGEATERLTENLAEAEQIYSKAA